MILYVDKNDNVLDVESSSTLSKYKQTITKNETQTEFTINHNLNTEDVIVQINNGEVPTFIDWKVIDKNNVKLSFSEPLDDGVNYNVTIFGSGNNSSNGGGISSGDIQELRDDIDDLRQSFQDGVDTIYNKCVSEGSTPTDNSPDAISDAIGNLRSEGTATESDILSGKTAYANKQLMTGNMTNNGNLSKVYFRKIANDGTIGNFNEQIISSGYYDGTGKIYPDPGVVFMPYLIASWLDTNRVAGFNYRDALVGIFNNEISSGVVNNDYSPYLFIAYNYTNKTICDYAIQTHKSSNEMISGIYNNMSFRIDSEEKKIFFQSLNQNYGDGNYTIHIRVYSLSYDINFNDT